MNSGPLDGITVLELGGFIAGPFGGQLLGDYGARVIKIEPPVGDPIRTWGVLDEGTSLWWHGLARNKESVVLDLRDAADRETAAQLCVSVDIVVENFAPGRLAEWGLDYAALSAVNPRLIMVHVSGYGQDGPRAKDRGFGSVAEAMGGLRYLTGYPDRPPVRVGISIGDAISGMFAVIGALAALRERDVSGCGQEVDVALYESVFALSESQLADWEVAGVRRQRSGSTLPGVAPSNVYTSADGRELLIAANADGPFQRLCEAMGVPELAADERFATHQARGAHSVEIDGIVQRWVGSQPLERTEAALDERGIPRGRIYTPADMLADPQYAAREMVARVPVAGAAGSVPMTGVVPKFSRTPGSIRFGGVELGRDTERVRTEFAAEPRPNH